MIRYGAPMKDRREKRYCDRGGRRRFEIERAQEEHDVAGFEDIHGRPDPEPVCAGCEELELKLEEQ